MSESKTVVDMLMACATIPNSSLKAEVEDAQWAHFGRRVHENVIGEGLVKAINRAGLKAKSTFELTAMVRAFILTGTLP